MTEPALPGDQLLALVSHLNSRRDGILEKWRTAVKDDSALSNASTLSSAQFYDHIPSVLDSFERNLCARNQADAVEAAEAQKELAADHGLHRWHHGYNQQEVMREWGHLHLCLVTELEFVPSLPVVPRLQIEPVALGHAEVMRETMCDVCADRTLSLDDLIDSAWRDADFFCKAEDADAARSEKLFEYYRSSRSNGSRR
jgi:hypothetical protein